MKFEYTRTHAVGTRGHHVLRPMIEVTAQGPKRKVTVVGLIDSGADTSLMNSRYADLLGIVLDELPSKLFVGIGGIPVTTHIATIPVVIPGIGNILNLPVAFTDSPTVDVLLGQEVFFTAYHIRFLKDEDLFEIKTSRPFWRLETMRRSVYPQPGGEE